MRRKTVSDKDEKKPAQEAAAPPPSAEIGELKR